MTASETTSAAFTDNQATIAAFAALVGLTGTTSRVWLGALRSTAVR